jgi:hypothetical protein
MKKFLKNFSFMGAFMLVLSVILGVGGFTGVAFANGVATGIETGGKDDAAKADAKGASVEHGLHGALETTDLRSLRPEMIDDPVDQNLVKIRPSVSPLDTILRYAGSKPTNNFEYEWYSIGTRAVDDKTSGTATITSSADVQSVQGVITVAGNINKFDVTDTILFPTINGGDGEMLVGYVVEKDVKNRQLTFTISEEQMTAGGDGKTIPAIPAETVIYSLGRAAGELDVKTPAISYIPKPSRGYCQIFMAQIAQSTYEKMMDKKVKFDVNEIEEQALYEYRVRMEGSFLFGKKGKVYNPNTNSYVYMTDGITRQIKKRVEINPAGGDAELIRVMKEIFTGNSGAKERVLLAGADFVEKMSTFSTVQKQLEAGNTEVVWGITWKKIESNFGSLLLVHHELLDQYGWSDKAIVLDPQYLKKWQISNFERKEYDGKELAIMNGNFTVFREVCGVAVYNPDAHRILEFHKA